MQKNKVGLSVLEICLNANVVPGRYFFLLGNGDNNRYSRKYRKRNIWSTQVYVKHVERRDYFIKTIAINDGKGTSNWKWIINYINLISSLIYQKKNVKKNRLKCFKQQYF